jgi:2-polyprenyl-3-methyl-5-hydroxy-6-metoxy-1,4-benzoquinol methylase
MQIKINLRNTLGVEMTDERKNCMVCDGNKLYKFIDLGKQPNGNNFLMSDELNDEPFFDLSMMVCEDCWHVQIAKFPSPEFMFSNHPYVTGVNAPVVRHFKSLSKHITTKYDLKKNDLVIDIGCNDGTLLNCFSEEGLRVLGVDPGERTGQLAKEKGLVIFCQFWSGDTGRSLKQLGVKPQLVTATAVFYHVPDLHDFLLGLVEVMDENTIFAVQGVNLRDLIEKNEFDHFYHEHSCIHSFGPLTKLFAKHGMRIQDVEMSEIHGGSYILYVVREENNRKTTSAVGAAIAADYAAGLNQRNTYDAFARRILDNMEKLKSLLVQLKNEGKTVYALGAPVKGATLLNFCGIGPDLVQAATEVNDFKINRVMPGTHIPVLDEGKIDSHPDYYLVLAWNFVDFFRDKYHDYLSNGGQFIVSVPEVEILGPK